MVPNFITRQSSNRQPILRSQRKPISLVHDISTLCWPASSARCRRTDGSYAAARPTHPRSRRVSSHMHVIRIYVSKSDTWSWEMERGLFQCNWLKSFAPIFSICWLSGLCIRVLLIVLTCYDDDFDLWKTQKNISNLVNKYLFNITEQNINFS